jgi:hypothetical protein
MTACCHLAGFFGLRKKFAPLKPRKVKRQKENLKKIQQ